MYLSFVAKIRYSQLREYLFEEDERGINREWILLVLVIKFETDDYIKIDKINEDIEIIFRDDYLYRFLLNKRMKNG